MTMAVWEFENAVWELGDIGLVVRTGRLEEVQARDFGRAYPGEKRSPASSTHAPSYSLATRILP